MGSNLSRVLPALVLCAALAAGCGSAPDTAEAQVPCVPVSEQSGWSDFEFTSYGDAQHAHAEFCAPLNQVVTGVYPLDVTVKLHNTPGQVVKRVRMYPYRDGGSGTKVEVVDPRDEAGNRLGCDTADCTHVVRLNVDTSKYSTGKWSWRVGVELAVNPASLNQRNLATGGINVCIRSCSGVTPADDRAEARGWYRDIDGIVHGYINSRWGWDASHDAEFPWIGAYVPVGGTWCPPLRTLPGAQEGQPLTVEDSFVSIDPDFHHGSEGTVVLSQTGPVQQRVCVDTATLTNGVHKLFIRAHSTNGYDGETWGAFVVPFEVAN